MNATELQTNKKINYRNLIAVGGGQAIENYDWMLYGLVAAYIGPVFFPGEGIIQSTLTALAVFGVSFAARPLGALIFGPLADRIGRKPMMLWSVAAMSVFALLMGVLPTADQIGPWAGVLLVALRLLQGMSIGVEQPLLATYGLEDAPDGKEGFYASLLQVCTYVGILASQVLTFIFTLAIGDEGMAAGGWRWPFIIGGVLGLGVLWLRRTLPETLDEEKIEDSSKAGVLKEIGRTPLAIFAIIFIVGGTQVINYGWNSGLPNAARAVFGESGAMVFGVTCLFTIILMIMAPIAGRIADHLGMGRAFVWTRLISIPLVFVLLTYAEPGVVAFAVAMAGGAIILPFALAFFNAISASLVPAGSRVTAVGLGYSIGVAVFGGTASYLLVWLSSLGLFWVFPTYIAAILLIGVIMFVLSVRRHGMHKAVYTTKPVPVVGTAVE